MNDMAALTAEIDRLEEKSFEALTDSEKAPGARACVAHQQKTIAEREVCGNVFKAIRAVANWFSKETRVEVGRVRFQGTRSALASLIYRIAVALALLWIATLTRVVERKAEHAAASASESRQVIAGEAATRANVLRGIVREAAAEAATNLAWEVMWR